MASTSETGHAKNVANLEEMIGFCTGYGLSYNPSKASIKLPALNTQVTNLQTTLAAVKAAKTAFDNATNARETAFKPLKKLATKVVNALAATDASKLTVEDVSAINMKIQGRRSGSKSSEKSTSDSTESVSGNGAPSGGNNISVSQQSFDNLVENFSRLTQALSVELMYKPNEVELQVATLNKLLVDLKAKNKAVVTAAANLSNARIARDEAMYAEGAGLYDTAQAIKQYVKSVFGASSPQYKQISGIKFTNSK